MAEQGFRITYATMSADNEQLHEQYEKGIEVAKSVRTGTYGVNTGVVIDLHSPFGGFKSSGIGRELGPEGLEEYCEIQTIVLAPPA